MPPLPPILASIYRYVGWLGVSADGSTGFHRDIEDRGTYDVARAGFGGFLSVSSIDARNRDGYIYICDRNWDKPYVVLFERSGVYHTHIDLRVALHAHGYPAPDAASPANHYLLPQYIEVAGEMLYMVGVQNAITTDTAHYLPNTVLLKLNRRTGASSVARIPNPTGISDPDYVSGIVVMDDGGVVVLCHRNLSSSLHDFMFTRFSADLAVQWQDYHRSDEYLPSLNAYECKYLAHQDSGVICTSLHTRVDRTPPFDDILENKILTLAISDTVPHVSVTAQGDSLGGGPYDQGIPIYASDEQRVIHEFSGLYQSYNDAHTIRRSVPPSYDHIGPVLVGCSYDEGRYIYVGDTYRVLVYGRDETTLATGRFILWQ